MSELLKACLRLHTHAAVTHARSGSSRDSVASMQYACSALSTSGVYTQILCLIMALILSMCDFIVGVRACTGCTTATRIRGTWVCSKQWERWRHRHYCEECARSLVRWSKSFESCTTLGLTLVEAAAQYFTTWQGSATKLNQIMGVGKTFVNIRVKRFKAT